MTKYMIVLKRAKNLCSGDEVLRAMDGGIIVMKMIEKVTRRADPLPGIESSIWNVELTDGAVIVVGAHDDLAALEYLPE